MLVGGKGTRLRPLTMSAPKPMLPVAGVPVTAHMLARARDAGIDRVVLATSYKAEVFEEYFGDGSSLGIELAYVTETEPLGTGGAIRNVAGFLRSKPDDPVVIFNGDILSGLDIAALIDRHQTADTAVTLHLTQVEDPRAFGVVPTDDDGRVTAFLEKTPDPPTNLINAGCYVFRRSVIDQIPAGRPVSVERETFPGLLAGGVPIAAYADSTYWLDLGTPAAFVRGSRDLVQGRIASSALPGPVGESLVLGGATIAADAKLCGGATVGAGASVGCGATVDGAVLFDGSSVGDGAVVRDSVVGRDAVICDGVQLDGVVVGDGARIEPGNELRAGVRVFPGATLLAGCVRFSSDKA
ncbi:Nucleotidyl transferase [Pseudofrankia inefficax]|uniref:Nucleotidyl transferase n=2 Tax=Pseudofrankia inefficax (strain DSM 45817 / CECT 9037 / DDB 130130 / EuI1c) TaxID=298654 RepID=E3J0Z5_PSEI1|nr:Nucleotidyl transferase [Pseudofrankia inefficax]